MRTTPSIAVVVPFFQSESHIRACIESLLQQDRIDGGAELILIDNGSSDASAAIAAEYGDVTRLKEVVPGAYAARNTGIRAATAPVIAFTDADCVADRTWLRSIQDRMRDPATAIVIGHCRYPPHASRALRMLAAYENAKAEYAVGRGAPSQWFAYANNMAVRASVFDEVGPFRSWARAADTELVQRLVSQRPGFQLVYDQTMRVTHLEFVTARARAKRLALYARTNSKIPTFRELSAGQRLAIVGHLCRTVLRR